MSTAETDHFTDMDGKAIEDSARAAAVPLLRQRRRSAGHRALARGRRPRTPSYHVEWPPIEKYNPYLKPNVAALEQELVDLRDRLLADARARGFEVPDK